MSKPLLVATNLLAALLAGFLAGCAPEAPEAPDTTWRSVADLTDVARWGDLEAETRRVDFSPESVPHLRSGWARPETDAEGRAFAWSVGDAAEVIWNVLEPRDRTLILRGWPFDFAGAETQRIRVTLGADAAENGSDDAAWVGAFDMKPGLHEYSVEIPARHWQAGRNVLGLVPSRATRPSDVSASGDSRRLAAAWTEIRRSGAPNDTDAPRLPVIEEERIFLPWNSRLDVFLDVPEGAAIDAERVSFRGAGRLRVELSGEPASPGRPGMPGAVGHSSVAVTQTEPPAMPMQLSAGPGPHRLRLEALGGEGQQDGGSPGGVVWVKPRISLPDTGESGASGASATTPSSPPDVASESPLGLPVPDVFVLYVVDTLRADQLAAWTDPSGQGKDTVPTPHLDAFAAESVVFRRATAQSPWTKASVASIFTGLWPPEHGAIDRDDRLPEDLPALPELLRQAGWRTEAVVTNPNLKSAFGFDRGFDHFDYLGEEADAFDVNRAVASRLEAHDSDAAERLFLYVHVLDPHSPYDPPPEWRERMAPEASAELARESLQRLNDLRQGRIETTPELMRRLRQLYRAEIASADAAFGEFLALLAAHDASEAAVLYVSDHGEEFLEHGNLGHGRAMHGESLWVPMALRWPALEPAMVDRPVQHLDVLPTVLPRLGASARLALPGADLLLPGASESRPIFSHLHLDGAERASVVHDGFKAIVEFHAGCDGRTGHRPERKWQLYDVENDPGETIDLSDERVVRLGFLRSLLRRQLGDCRAETAASRQDVELDEETRRSLEALGYL